MLAMSLPVALVVVSVFLGALVLRRQVRDRQRLSELIERLDRLEAALLEPGQSESPGSAADVDTGRQLTADVLAGRTSYVRNLVGSPAAPFQSLADQSIVCVHNSIALNLTPRELADAVCVSLRTLERALAETLGCTPRQLILAMKMREAHRLLTQGARVGEVADRLGFVNAFYFSRRFKAFYHVAPSEIRGSAGDSRVA
jgi:AraC-like DNA-binding protein